MAECFNEPSRTFNEYLLVPGYSAKECTVDNVDLSTPVTKYQKGEEPAIKLKIPMLPGVLTAKKKF